MKQWTKPFEHRNHFYEAHVRRRPHQDGMEACVSVKGKPVRVWQRRADLGEKALIEKLKAEIDRALN